MLYGGIYVIVLSCMSSAHPQLYSACHFSQVVGSCMMCNRTLSAPEKQTLSLSSLRQDRNGHIHLHGVTANLAILRCIYWAPYLDEFLAKSGQHAHQIKQELFFQADRPICAAFWGEVCVCFVISNDFIYHNTLTRGAFGPPTRPQLVGLPGRTNLKSQGRP